MALPGARSARTLVLTALTALNIAVGSAHAEDSRVAINFRPIGNSEEPGSAREVNILRWSIPQLGISNLNLKKGVPVTVLGPSSNGAVLAPVSLPSSYAASIAYAVASPSNPGGDTLSVQQCIGTAMANGLSVTLVGLGSQNSNAQREKVFVQFTSVLSCMIEP